MTTSIDTGRKTRPWAVAVYLGFVFVLILSWMVIQPLNASPDELMRYDIVVHCRMAEIRRSDMNCGGFPMHLIQFLHI